MKPPQKTSEAAAPSRLRQPQLAVWIGLLITILAEISYFLSVEIGVLRNFAVPNVLIALFGAGVAGVGCLTVFRQPKRIVGKGFAALGVLLAVAFTGLFSYFIFVSSSDLPEIADAPAVGTTAPDFALPDHEGERVQLSDYRGQRVVLLFFRGFW